MNYERINFKNGQLVSPGSVDLETGELTMPVYTGETPINDVNLNKMDEAIEYLFENGALNGVVLYENESGSKTPTLSNSTSDYSRIDIELYDTNTLNYNTITIYSPNGKNYLYSRCETGTASWYLYQIIFTISDTSIIYVDSYTYAGHKSEYRDYTTWVITKVIGYK